MTALSAWWALWRWRWWQSARRELLRRAVAGQAAMPSTLAERDLLWEYLRQLQRVQRWVPGSRCLDRTLALCAFADRHKIAVALKIGVSKTAAGFRAHAWAEAGGMILDPDPPATAAFLPLSAPPKDLEFD